MHCPRCGAAIAEGAIFCSRCGSALPGRQTAAGERTRIDRPAPPVSPAAVAAGFGPHAKRRPVWLLAVLILLLIGGLTVAGVLLLRRPGEQSVVAAARPAAVPEPGALQGAHPELPEAPPAVSGQVPPPAPGSPALGARKAPESDLPPMHLGSPSRPGRGPSVTASEAAPPAPPAPPAIAGQSPPAPAAPPAVGGQSPPPRPGAPATANVPPPQRDNSDFDRYIRWLRFVENERAGLRAQGETESFRVLEAYMSTLLGFADPDANDIVLQQQFEQRLRSTMQRTLYAIRAFRTNILRTKPPVPSDCRALDAYYMAAMEREGIQTLALLEALQRRDIGTIQRLARSGVAEIDTNLGMANLELEKVYRGRGLNQQFRIQTGGNASLLGGLIGLGTLR